MTKTDLVMDHPVRAAGAEPTRLQCLQVWGGTGAVDTSVTTTGLDVWHWSRPFGGQAAGGDVFYLSSCSSGRITRMALADVSGHGDEVADLAASLRGLMRRHIDHIDHRRLVRALNTAFVSAGDSTAYATGLVATFFVPTATLTVSNAGHPAPLVYQARTRSWAVVESAPSSSVPSNVPFGLFEATTYSQVSLAFRPGDLLLWFTDGLFECNDEDGDLLGYEGILRIVRDLDTREPASIVPELVRRTSAMSTGNLSSDDVTISLIRASGGSVPLRDNLLGPFRFLSELLVRARSGLRHRG